MRNALLCAADDAEYHEREIRLSQGDRLVLFTDGITETARSSEIQFGVQRLGSFLQDRFDSSPKDLFDELKKELLSFSGRKEFEDDCTLLIISR